MSLPLIRTAFLSHTHKLTPLPPSPPTIRYGESTIRLCHVHGSENDDSFAINTGNVEPHRGFGHIAVMTPDVYAASEELEAAGVKFQKRPNEGRMKGLAFALDPDGYWVEIVSRNKNSVVPASLKFSFAQTMLRVKDAAASVAFYCNTLGMTNLREIHFPPESGDFSLYFLAQLAPGQTVPAPTSEDSAEYIRSMFPQVLELTHNHGTESRDSTFAGYHNGNDEDLDAGVCVCVCVFVSLCLSVSIIQTYTFSIPSHRLHLHLHPQIRLCERDSDL